MFIGIDRTSENDETDISYVSESPPLESPTLSSESPTLTLTLDHQELPVWSCSPLSSLCYGPSAYPILPSLRSTATHCVAVRGDVKPDIIPQPYPSVFKDIWDGNHVRMPCSAQSLYPVGPKDSSRLERKWDLVVKALSKPMLNSFDLEEAILSYNSRFSSKWQFRGLHCYFTDYISIQESNDFFKTTLPKIVHLALNLPKLVTHAIPLLRKQQGYSLTLSQQQIACLLANAFFCTYPRRNTTTPSSEYSRFPSINFNTLFSGTPCDNKKMNKLRCIFNYFRRVTETVSTGTVTFTRQVCTKPPQWEHSMERFSKFHMTSEGTIEDSGHGMLQVDFANKYIGGGVLTQGCVQEEIRFLISLELLVSRLFTEELDDNECLLITGAEQYSAYRGYAATFEWAGDYIDSTVRDEWSRREIQLVAIDALVFGGKTAQFKPGLMCRELNKAYCGFMSDECTHCGQLSAVATGNWGCGAFGGEPRLKALLQWMAASVAKRDMVYFTFDKKELIDDLTGIYNVVVSCDVTVGQMWKCLVDYHTTVIKQKKNIQLVEYLKAGLTST